MDGDSVMIIDSDEDQPAPKAQQSVKFIDKPQFEEEIEETPYPEIVQSLDLTLGTAVLKVAVLPLAPRAAQDAAGGKAALLSDKMVFAVSCVTNDIYIITVPLTPPSPESKARPELRSDLLASKAGSGAWGESLVLLGGQTKLSDGISLGLILPGTSKAPGDVARVVVASHSREASGILRLWQVPLDTKAGVGRSVEPFQTEYLPNPLTSLVFNPTHTTQLLAVSSPNGTRIYDFALSSLPPDPEQTGPYPAQGSWLLTLYQPFIKGTSSRKPVVDAAWISHGRAIFVLLADGMWGIWDIDGASLPSSAPAISTKTKSSVQGSATTRFSASGYVEGTSSLRSAAPQSTENQSGDFAPMTPHTRRQATASLGSAAAQDRLATVQGGLKVIVLPNTGQSLPDEAVAFWIGGLEHVGVIPAVSRFWDSHLRKGGGGSSNLFSGTQLARMVKLQDLTIGLLGEQCSGISLIADISPSKKSTPIDNGLPVEIVIRGETRVVIVRESQEGPGKKVGGIASRKRLFSKGDQSSAIIVYGKPRPASTSFDLSTVGRGSLRLKAPPAEQDTDITQLFDQDQTPRQSRPALNFGFGSTLNEAADITADLSRDVEAEMLDIMEIDDALDNLDGTRGRKKVLFEDRKI